MTQALNLGLLANNLNSSGQLDATDGLTGAVPAGNGGTGLTSPGASGNVLQSNGTAWVSAAIGSYSGPSSQSFGSSGTFTVPAGVTKVIVSVWAGGGGGQGARNPGFGGNGSTGGFGKALITGLTPGATISVTVGSGGNGGNAVGTVGASGGTSSFGSYISCTGGAGGNWGITSNGSATFSGVNTILNNPSLPNGNTSTLFSIVSSLGLGDVAGPGSYLDTGRFPGGGGGGGCGGGGAGGNGDAGTVTPGALAYGPGATGGSSPSANGSAGGAGGGNNVSSNGGAAGAGSSGIWGGGGGGGGGFVFVEW